MKPSSQKSNYIREVKISYKKKRVKSDSPVGKTITDARQIVELFSDLQSESKEKLIVISLNSELTILCFEVVAMGSGSTVSIQSWDTVRVANLVGARGIIIVHNHPSGNPKPSPEDRKFTRRIKKFIDLAGGVSFHDHIIIGADKKYFSFANEGKIL